jgi:hypothetical protein
MALAQTAQQTVRNPNGQVVGRTVTDSRGNTTFYNPLGQNTGRSTTNQNGTTFYNNRGQQTGTVRMR